MQENRDGPLPPTMVLVVVDDPAVRNSLKFSLELEGFAVRLYANGRELLDDPHLPTYGCLVIDQVMPATDSSVNQDENAPGLDGRSEGVARAKGVQPRRRTFPQGVSAIWRS
jgi:CheY-like chemotaxis protein